MPQFSERERYISGGRVSVAGVLLFVMGAVGSGLVAGWCLSRGGYVVFWKPLVMAAAMSVMLCLLVDWVRCRNPHLAGGLSLMAGALAYASYFYFSMQRDAGGGLVPVEVLPNYILFRMQNDVLKDVKDVPRGGAKPAKPAKPVEFFNWMFGACDLFILMGVPCEWARRRAQRAFSSEHNRWYRIEKVKRWPYLTQTFVDALNTGEIDIALRDTPTAPMQHQGSRFLLEWLDVEDTSPLDFPVYGSIEDQSQTGFAKSARRMVHRQFALTPQEALSLRPFFPKFSARLDVQHPELQAVPATLFARSKTDSSSDLASVTPVEEPYRQLVRDRGYKWKVTLIDLIPLIYMVGGVGVMFLSLWLFDSDGQIPIEFETPRFVMLGIGALCIGGCLFVWGCYAALMCQSGYSSRWIASRLRTELAHRPHLLVDLANPQTRYVLLIPGEEFTRIQMIMASDVLLADDVLFMELDDHQREIRMEGDIDRYIIPAGAISDCQPRCYFHNSDAHQFKQVWMVRLLIQREMGEQELLIGLGQLRWKRHRNRDQEQAAREVCDRINGWRSGVTT